MGTGAGPSTAAHAGTTSIDVGSAAGAATGSSTGSSGSAGAVVVVVFLVMVMVARACGGATRDGVELHRRDKRLAWRV